MPALEELVEYVAKALVDQPEKVVVRDGASGLDERVIVLQVAADDRGKIIGKKGRTAHALRSLLSAASKGDRPVSLEIAD